MRRSCLYIFWSSFLWWQNQIRLKNQHYIGVSHMLRMLLNTSGFSHVQWGQIGTTCAKHPLGWPCLCESYTRLKCDQKSPVRRAERAKPTLGRVFRHPDMLWLAGKSLLDKHHLGKSIKTYLYLSRQSQSQSVSVGCWQTCPAYHIIHDHFIPSLGIPTRQP